METSNNATFKANVGNLENNQDFTEIPVIDYASRHTAEFLAELRNICLNIGFMYVKNLPIDKDLLERMKEHAKQLFNLPQQEKDAIRMNESFLGYNRLGYEVTRGQVDHREQFDFGPDTKLKWTRGKDAWYKRIYGPGPFPSSLPQFHQDCQEYIKQLTDLSYDFLALIAVALNLPKDTFNKYADDLTRQGGSMKIIKYPPVKDLGLQSSIAQGCGPHRDPWITFLLQLDDLPGLQVQNKTGQWIDCTPMPDTFVVNFGTLLERVTRGAIIATTHQVLNPPGNAARYSMPFFQRIALDAEIVPMPLEQLPSDLQQILKDRNVVSDAAPEQYPKLGESDGATSTTCWGQAFLYNRIRSHPDVGYLYYPEIVQDVLRGFDSKHPAANGLEKLAPLSQQ